MADPPGTPRPGASGSAHAGLFLDVKLERDTAVNLYNPFQMVDDVFHGKPSPVGNANRVAVSDNADLSLQVITQQQADAPADNSVKGKIGRVDIKSEGFNQPPLVIPPRYMHEDSSIGNLEHGVAEGLQFLGPLKSLLQKYSRQPENKWLKQIEELEKRAVPARVIIGVVLSELQAQETVEFSEDDPILFYTKLQKYVNSTTRTRRKRMKGESKANDRKDFSGALGGEKESMKFWLLIRVVRLYVKAPVLATGAVIVDLPGMQDANAARAAVASRYIEQCSSVWIVAPITRAVDDKTAKTLLSKNFQRQIQMDGALSAPFSTPDIPEISITRLEEQLRALKEERTELVISIDELCEETATLGCDLDLLKGTNGSPKRNRVTDFNPLPLKQEFGRYRENDNTEYGPDYSNMGIDSRQTEDSKQDILGMRCILERNHTVKAQIRQDLVDGIRQLDEADAEEESFDPSVDLRDYD
ncbi:hypothetical protein ACJ73_04005 [Blastomyces percursus]|uniref:Uncharacterized protein n=1 Tax=Blastomyces percursus TaxID=1658174 RepID=A0A1J9RAD5_9EURO|nr:hypothetical protein ACJ73_04005 [Blastomyces percursus]